MHSFSEKERGPMYVDSFNVAEKVESRYKGIKAIKLISLKNFFGDTINMKVYQVEFQVIGSLGATYKTNILKMEEGHNFSNFDEVIAAKVYTFLKELNLLDSNYQDFSEENPVAFEALYKKCRAFIFETFDVGGDEVGKDDYTYNNFFELLVDMCMISAYSMIAANEECNFYTYFESKRRFDVITNKSNSWGDLFKDVEKKVQISVKPEKVIHSHFYVNTYRKVRNVLHKLTGVLNSLITK